jgi:hypothetical protein
MSLLGRYLDWFREQGLPEQIGSSIALFIPLFVLGVYTAGVAPGVIVVALLIDHWYRG